MSDNRQSKRPRRKGFFSGANASSTSMTTRAMAKSTNLTNLTKMTRPTKPTRRSPRKGSPQWPANALPVEIFECIASYLPRSTILNMRLVNKEFEASVAACLFQVVVVGFNPQLYGVAEPKVTNYVLQNSIMLQDKGMRVFQGFGKWIKRFGMSFEIDMQKLTSPPTKVDQVTVPAFWGYYQWPHTDYHRYPNLEGLEQTADETGSMAKAMHFVSTANELALSIDAGLGWLAGPDINQRVAARGEKLTVFSASRFVKEPARQPSRSVPGNRGLSSPLTTSLEYDLQDAGYDLDSLDPELRTMLQNHALDDALDDAQYQQNVQVLDNNNASGGSVNLGQASMPRLRSQQLSLLLGLDDGADNNAEYAVPRRILRNALIDLTKDVYVKTICPLKPNDLTAAQREMLLEMEWAQMAFTQSWAIAVMDNHKTFNNILTLNLARVPHRHLAILCREDFWDSLPSVETLQLGVIPDWREVKKEETSYVQDTRLAPSQSIFGVYKLLSTHIAHRNNIKSLHFEWLGGGEYAPGLFARNRHVMAAPVVPNARDMVNRELPGVEQCAILHLPHIEDLSFKNCYFTPHVLERLLSRLRKCALKTIGFNSVSLTANVPQGSHPNPTSQAAQNANALQAFQWNAAAAMHMAVVGGGGPQMGVNAMAAPGLPHPGAGAVGNPANWFFQQGILYPPGQVPPGPPPPPFVPPTANASSGPSWLSNHRVGCWVSIINSYNPATTLENIRFMRGIKPDPPARVASSITKMTLKSCGYVRLPLDFDQGAVDNAMPVEANTAAAKRMADIDSYMMKPADHYLGTIVNHMHSHESLTLEAAWNLTVGWQNTRTELAADAALDGFPSAGQGRFDGEIPAPAIDEDPSGR